MFLFLTYYMQENLGFSPVKTGLSFLPMTAVLVVTSTTVQTRVLYRTGAKPLVAVGMTLGVIAMLLLTRLSPGASYASHVLPSLLIIGVGMGCIFAPAFSTATLGVDGSEAGVASAMVNTSQQVGGSVGTALLSTIFASAVAAYAASHIGAPAWPTPRRSTATRPRSRGPQGSSRFGLLLALIILPSKAKARVSESTRTVDERTAIAPRTTAPATPILVTGPCCHFAVTVRVVRVQLSAGVPRNEAGASR